MINVLSWFRNARHDVIQLTRAQLLPQAGDTVHLQSGDRNVAHISCQLRMPLGSSPGNLLSVTAPLCAAIVLTSAHLAREWKQMAVTLRKEGAEGSVPREWGRIHFPSAFSIVNEPKLSLCPKRSLTFATVSILKLWLRTKKRSFCLKSMRHRAATAPSATREPSEGKCLFTSFVFHLICHIEFIHLLRVWMMPLWLIYCRMYCHWNPSLCLQKNDKKKTKTIFFFFNIRSWRKCSDVMNTK